jgi:hypothetical protein
MSQGGAVDFHGAAVLEGSLRQSEPAQQVDVAGVGAEIVQFGFNLQESDVVPSFCVGFLQLFKSPVLVPHSGIELSKLKGRNVIVLRIGDV